MATETETVYTLTDADGWTRRACANALHWGEGVTHTATGTDGVVHWYDSPELAAMMDPIHGCYGADAICWRATVEEVGEHDGTTGGSRSLTTLERVPLPQLSLTQRVEIAIRVTLLWETDLPAQYVTWARRWLDGSDRTGASAAATAWVTEAEVAVMAADAAAAWTTAEVGLEVARAAFIAARAAGRAAARAVAAGAAEAGWEEATLGSLREYAATVTRIVRDVLDRDREVA